MRVLLDDVVQVHPAERRLDLAASGVLTTGSRGSNHYSLVQVDGAAGTQVFQSRDEILFQPRPSPDGRAVIVMGRLFLPALYELPRAAVR